MSNTKTLIAALMATTVLTAGAAFAADQAMQANQMQANQAQAKQEQTTLKDAGKLSADGSRAYNDLALTRLAIFDGRVKDAKSFVKEADAAFDKAKTDDSVFMKAEADLKSPEDAANTSHDTTAAEKPAQTATASDNANPAKQVDAAKDADMTTPKKWLPIDAEMSVDENYTANPKKVAAVADANKSLAKGDKQGAMEKLKLADVNVAYVMAVVPLTQTLSDVHQAATMVNDGKYYQASQMLRQVQDSTRYDMLDVNGVPTKAGSQGTGKTEQAPATH